MKTERIRPRQRNLLRINIKDVGYWLLLVFLTLPHMKPAYLSRIPAVDLIIDILRGASFLIIVLWYVIKRKSVSLVIILVAVWQAFLVYSTLVHAGEVYNSIVSAFSILSVMLLYDTAYNSEKNTFLSAQLFCFELAIYINLLTEILYPKGLYTSVSSVVHTENWFIGYYNNHTQYFIPALMFAWLYWARIRKVLRPFLLTAAIFVSAILVWSGGVLLSLLCMTLVFLFFKNRTKLLNYYTYWLMHIVFFVGVYVLHIHEWFDWLLVGILGKLSSLTFRIDLWERTLKLIVKSPIIGHGVQSSITRASEVYLVHGVHAHNMLLEQLYQGGVIGLILWVIIVIVAGRKLMKYGYTLESKIISTAFLGWCVATLVEPFTTPFLMGMFVIAYRSNRGETLAKDCTTAESHREKPRIRHRMRISMR